MDGVNGGWLAGELGFKHILPGGQRRQVERMVGALREARLQRCG
jgi:hypothetical protein